MEWTVLPFDAPLEAYEAQARELHDAWRAADEGAVRLFRHRLPRFLRTDVPWLPRDVSDAEVLAAPLDLDDARTATARAYDFLDWPSLVAYAFALRDDAGAAARFERAVEAVVDGDVHALEGALRRDPALVHARSARVCPFDPTIHRSTLLHYVAANGVEGQRQRTPATAVEVADLLLRRGADADALADLYGGECTTMTLLVSSDHPARAGLTVPLVDVLVAHGGSVDARGRGAWASPLLTALTFGNVPAAHALVRHGAVVDSLAAAAGLADLDAVRSGLATASPEDRHRALALAAQLGHLDVLDALLDAGESPDRYNPPNLHAHATPMHQAVAAGHLDVVQRLVERGARTDMKDRTYDATPLEWAEHLGQDAIAAFLRSR